MIPKAEILSVANDSGLLPTTVEKDYVLGWVLNGIASHRDVRLWIFKGGTCLKKCYFETYRFSEDLDFTVPAGAIYAAHDIGAALKEVCEWVERQSGIEFPPERMMVEEITNRRGNETFQARVSFVGPLRMPTAQIQRIKLDISRDELLVDVPDERPIYHPYSDALADDQQIRCYTLHEILAEKTRALHERSGRSRDVYDVVNIGRNFRDEVELDRVRDIVQAKFQFKGLPAPTPDLILASIDAETLAPDWQNALGHQLAVLPPMDDFLTALRDAVEWLLGEGEPARPQEVIPGKTDEQPVPRLRFAGAPKLGALDRGMYASTAIDPSAYSTAMDRVRYAARNRLLARVGYHGVERLVEPYSLRMPGPGNLLLYVFERERGGMWSDSIKAFKIAEISGVEVTTTPFQPRYLVEL